MSIEVVRIRWRIKFDQPAVFILLSNLLAMPRGCSGGGRAHQALRRRTSGRGSLAEVTLFIRLKDAKK
ncbi:hypothetical protein EAS62_39620 [Bradyrhizobium zhanjiangense]|uniref:Uncharacterized protein n=1 Tax=Bradyrhizobium zhanjiangense TaxID=1325107 RepID=A0ABY0D936_9BRAD|nr:hypothetical protein EAS62_39620 [Bradyrhizobium zhanjiangense]